MGKRVSADDVDEAEAAIEKMHLAAEKGGFQKEQKNKKEKESSG
jgi:hypothetical protein